MAYGSVVLQRELHFSIQPGEILSSLWAAAAVAKSTLLRHLIGLLRPAKGEVLYDGESLWSAPPENRARMMRRFGVLYQSGALWSSMTLAENVALPLGEYTALSPRQMRDVVSLKLALVGLAGLKTFIPPRSAAACASARAWRGPWRSTPTCYFLTNPRRALDPISSRRLDDLLLELRDSLGATVVVVTHELASMLTIGDNGVFLDLETKTMLAVGNPKTLREYLARAEDSGLSSDGGRRDATTTG